MEPAVTAATGTASSFRTYGDGCHSCRGRQLGMSCFFEYLLFFGHRVTAKSRGRALVFN